MGTARLTPRPIRGRLILFLVLFLFSRKQIEDEEEKEDEKEVLCRLQTIWTIAVQYGFPKR